MDVTAATEVILPLNVVLNEFLRSAEISSFWTTAIPALFTSTLVVGQLLILS